MNNSLALSLSVHREAAPPFGGCGLRLDFLDFVLFVFEMDAVLVGVPAVGFVGDLSDLADDWLLLCDILRASPESWAPWDTAISGNGMSPSVAELRNLNASSVSRMSC